MNRTLVHFELFVRRHPRAPWRLALATEDRQAALDAANETMATRAGSAVRVCKETRDTVSGDFHPLVLLERGVRPQASPGPRRWRPRKPVPRNAPARASCAHPSDLYAAPAREAIGRLFAGWLARNRVTPFELLHRADLAERLEACQAEMSAALYNAALADAAARGAALEPTLAALTALARRTVERIVGEEPDTAYRFGAAVASRLGRQTHWRDKLELVLDLIEAAPDEGAPASVSRRVLQQPLTDILGGVGDLSEIFGADRSLGEQLLIMVQIASAPAIAAVVGDAPELARVTPRLKGVAARLAVTLHARPYLLRARRALARRVVAEVAGEAPLWPNDPAREVEGLQALAALLTVSSRLVDQDEAAAALAGRWRRLSETGFVDTRLAACKGALEEADVLLDMIGAARGRFVIEAFGGRLLALIASRPFEAEARFAPDPLQTSLGRLARLVARVREAPLSPGTAAEATQRLRRLAACLEADAYALCA